jgi:hypothetical protein
MIQKIRNSKYFKNVCFTLSILGQIIVPLQALSLTGGPGTPETSKFAPIGVSDMVDLSSGDMTYNIPLMDVGGYPLNIAYSSGISSDDEATNSGLGWNVSIGQVNHNVRGLPDDFNGNAKDPDIVDYEDFLRPNITVGGSFKFAPYLVGAKLDKLKKTGKGVSSTSYSISISYNNYTGLDIKPSFGVSIDITKNFQIGLEVDSGKDGLSVSPDVSFDTKKSTKSKKMHDLGGRIGCSFNSRQGLTGMSLSASKKENMYNARRLGVKRSNMNREGTHSIGSSIAFNDNIYSPTLRNGMSTESFTATVAFGGEVFGAEGQVDVTAYGTKVGISDDERSRKVKAFGYLHTGKSIPTEKHTVTDVNREKDGALSENTANLHLTNYTYDLHSVQGQGVSGQYRPYRNQIGFIFDGLAKDKSTSGSIGAELGVGNIAHYGFDADVTRVNSHSGVWRTPILNYFKNYSKGGPDYEEIHYKNVGDMSVDRNFSGSETSNTSEQMFSRVGGYDAVNLPVVGIMFARKLEAKYHGKYTNLNLYSTIKRTKRQIRNQSITHISVDEVAKGIGYGPNVKKDKVEQKGRGHHVGEIHITRNDGARYIYGLPAYNLTKKEVTFALDGSSANHNTGLVDYSKELAIINSKKYDDLVNDQFFNSVTTPSYAYAHLLTSVLSADYQDIETGGVLTGPSAGDLGSYTKIIYEKELDYQWRVPFEENKASHNEGLKTDENDDQGNYVYGKKEIYNVKRIETKTHVAVFTMTSRQDALGVKGEHGGADRSNPLKKIKKISLYSLPDYNADPTKAVPIKEVHFEYSYDLCKGRNGIINNLGNSISTDGSEISNNKGKLTLKKIYFTYKNSHMGKYTNYEFDYDENNPNANPEYNLKGYDCWGNYKENKGDGLNSSVPTTMEHPYVDQDNKVERDIEAAVWTLKKINLPSGGSIQIEYESDSYSYVQDRKVMKMYQVEALSSQNDLTKTQIEGNGLTGNTFGFGAAKYMYIKIPSTSTFSASDYLSGFTDKKMQFRFLLNMTKFGSYIFNKSQLNQARFDYVSGYAEVEPENSEIKTIDTEKYLVVSLKLIKSEGGFTPGIKVNPIAKAGWNFGRKNLSTYVYDDGNGPAPSTSAKAILNEFVQIIPRIFSNLAEMITGPEIPLGQGGIARTFVKKKSFVRLNMPEGNKLGGGCRVKTVKMNDVWERMNNEVENTTGGYKTMNYGQAYSYTLEDGINTSGVATYEPTGNKENPFVEPVFVTEEHLLAPDDVNYQEKPFGESFFPSPQVTYSRVSVSNLTGGELTGLQKVKALHKTGHVVTEFYTSKDYPTIVDQTKISGKEDDTGVLGGLLKVFSKKVITLSQGYVIHLNDMNGKQKKQSVYAEGITKPISEVKHYYDTHQGETNAVAANTTIGNVGRLDNRVTVIYPNGDIKPNTVLGVEYDVVNDFRENESNTTVGGAKFNTAGFVLGIIPGFVPLVLPKFSRSITKSYTATTTKVINTFGIERETVAREDGSEVSTRNLAWDAYTGEVLVTETVDEYEEKYYTMNYPAHWSYPGMGPASLNSGFEGTAEPISGGDYCSLKGNAVASDYLIDGDEIAYLENDEYKKAWIEAVSNDQFLVVDKDDVRISLNSKFKVIRSGHRNLQSAGIMNVTLMHNPLMKIPTASSPQQEFLKNIDVSFLVTNDWSKYRIINAGAVEYSDNWALSCECNTPAHFNAYLYNEKGVWRTKASHTYLTGRNYQASTTSRREGFFTSFSPFYQLNSTGNWIQNKKSWTFVSQVSKFSQFGFELENKDALDRYSGAQYGYANKLPMAVGANTRYQEIGFDGFEDYDFSDCRDDAHFKFDATNEPTSGTTTSPGITKKQAHTGKSSILVTPGDNVKMTKNTSTR